MKYGKLLIPPAFNSDLDPDRMDIAFGRKPDTAEEKALPDTYPDRVKRALEAHAKARVNA